jgi:inhibitor of cysteine peptidase
LPQPIDIRRPGSYNFGKWQYRLDIANPGTRGEGRWGSLWYDGQKLPRGAINDYYRTPWGPIYWVDVPATPWGLHGWMPVPLGQNNRQGRPLAVPAALAAPGKPEPPSNQKTLEVGKADSGRRARLYIGNILVVRLPANPGTGYQWQLGPTSSPTVRLMAEPQFVASPAPPGVMGASGTYVFMLQAVRPGTGIVRLVYARPWERDRTAADTFSLAVDVLPGAVSGPGRTAALPAGAVGGPSGPNSAPRGN